MFKLIMRFLLIFELLFIEIVSQYHQKVLLYKKFQASRQEID